MIKDINDITDQQCVIIYGNDIGKVRQNKIKFLEKIMPDYRTNIGFIDITHTLSKAKPNEDDENIKSDGVLFNEFNTMSLFAPRKVIVLNIPPDADKKLKEIARSYMDDIKNLFAGQIKSNAIIVITADYDMNDAFKKLNNDKIAVLCCYEDDINNIKNVIKNNLASFNYGPDVFNYLCDCLGDNRDILLNELEKLKMYKGGEKAITLNDVKKCIQDETGANINDLVNAVANLDMENTYLEINKLLSDGYATIMQLRILITYFLKLQLYRYKMNNGFTLDELEKGNRMFWKTGNTMRMHLEKLSLDNINHALQSLLQEERILKSSSYFN